MCRVLLDPFSVNKVVAVDNGFTIQNISSGLGHTLISYQSEGVGRVFASGRNELGQLGVGFNSQEGTRGLVEGFSGESIRGVGTGVQSSYLVTRDDGELLSSRGGAENDF